MLNLISSLFPLNRTLAGTGFQKALDYIRDRYLPSLEVLSYPSGADCWGWTLPDEWEIEDAFIEDESTGERLLSLSDTPLRVASYSIPVDAQLTGESLLDHLRWDDHRPEAIPFIYLYYKRDWAFCIRKSELGRFKKDRKYRVLIKSSFRKGSVCVGRATIHGDCDKRIAFIAHLCHPAQANDDLAGVAVGVKLFQDLAATFESRRPNYTYDLLLVPETIGSIAYLYHNQELQPHYLAGVFLEMLGLDQPLRLQCSYDSSSWINRLSSLCLQELCGSVPISPFRLGIGNDELIWDGTGIEIPTISLHRAQYPFYSSNEGIPFPEYHSDWDDMRTINASGLNESLNFVHNFVVRYLEHYYIPNPRFTGAVCFDRFALWNRWGSDKILKTFAEYVMRGMNGKKSTLEIFEAITSVDSLKQIGFSSMTQFLDDLSSVSLVSKVYGRAPEATG